MLFANQMIDSNADIPRHLRVAVIGTGFAEKIPLPVFRAHPATEVVAICSRTEANARRVAKAHDIPAYYTDYRRLLAAEAPDLVNVVTPPHLHLEMTLAALEAGAHVLCEKPLAMNVAQAQQMLEAAQQHGKVHVVNHEFRYLPARFYQKVLVEEGYIGQPLTLEGTFKTGRRADPGLAWTWWSDAEAGGGALAALASHLIDTFRWLVDDEFAEVTALLHTTYPTRRTADGQTRPVTADDAAVLGVTMQGGAYGNLHVSSVAQGPDRRVMVHGTAGVLVVTEDAQLLGRRQNEPALRPINIPARYQPAWQPTDGHALLGAFYQLVEMTLAQIFGRPYPAAYYRPADFTDGLAVQRVLDTARQAHQQGRRLPIAPPA